VDDLHVPEVRNLHSDSCLLQSAAGDWSFYPYPDDVVCNYITQYSDTELKEPGSFRVRIPAFRNAVRNAPCLDPSQVKVFISASEQDLGWRAQHLRNLAASPDAQSDARGLTIRPSANHMIDLRTIGSRHTSWHVTE